MKTFVYIIIGIIVCRIIVFLIFYKNDESYKEVIIDNIENYEVLNQDFAYEINNINFNGYNKVFIFYFDRNRYRLVFRRENKKFRSGIKYDKEIDIDVIHRIVYEKDTINDMKILKLLTKFK